MEIRIYFPEFISVIGLVKGHPYMIASEIERTLLQIFSCSSYSSSIRLISELSICCFIFSNIKNDIHTFCRGKSVSYILMGYLDEIRRKY